MNPLPIPLPQNHNTRASEHPQLLEGLNKAISEYHLIEGGSFQIRDQVNRLREFVAKRQPKSIMEIGFNGGHSALLFLSITPPETKVVSFDLGEYAYVFAAKRYIDSVFPGRHTLVTGDSTATIPNYEEQVAHRLKNPETAPPLKFDLIFVDGGHQDDIPLKDILNSQRLARDDTTIVAIDDICRDPARHAHYTVEPTKAWDQMVKAGVIHEDGFDDYYEIMNNNNETDAANGCKARGMAWGTYSLLPGVDDEAGDTGAAAAADAAVSAAKSDPTSAFKKLRYNYYQNSCKFMDRNQMLQEIHNQHHHYKDLEKLIAVADMYLDYFPTYNKRDSNFVRFYRACANFTVNPLLAVKQFEEIVDTPSPPPNDSDGANNSESELPDSIKHSAIANIGMLYGDDPCSSIPKIIHLLYFGETEFYNFQHRCVHSMLQYMPDYDVRIYNAKEPVGNPFWDDIKKQPRVSIHKLDPPVFFDGFELKHFQYKADVVRLELLYEHGGVYLDLDMLITRPFHEVFASGHSFYISEERPNGAGDGALINAFLAAKPKNEFMKLWLNEFKSGLRLGIWATHIRDSNKKLIQEHPHYIHKYKIRVLDGKLFMALHWQDTVAFIHSETAPYEFPPESYGTHLWETILGDVMKKNEFLHKQKMELTVYNSRSSAFYAGSDRDATAAAATDDDLTIYPEYYHDYRNDQYVDKYVTKGKHGGYFIEIGAGDGETNSACYFFERYREWRGLTVEPARVHHEKIRTCRATLLPVAVSSVTSSITNGSGRGAIFYESANPNLSGLKGTLENVKEGEEWTRNGFKSYKVDTITLYDMCCQQSAPEQIDYCAMDCEGAEYEILSTFFEENQATPAIDAGSSGGGGGGGGGGGDDVALLITNKVFQINFFSMEVASDKMYTKIRDLMKKHQYEEVVNPYLSVTPVGAGAGAATAKTQKAYFKYKGTGATNSPQLSDRSLSSVSSTANFTPNTTQTPPSSPSPSSPDLSSVSGAGAGPVNASFLSRPPFAEEVVAICLEERPERTSYVSNELLSHGIRHSLLMNKINTENTKIGCFRSHIKAIQYAQSKNLSSVLIVEDDIVIRDNIHELEKIGFPNNSNNWDILYLGGILTRYDGIDSTHKWVNGTIWCNHAYIVKQHMYKPILDFIEAYPNLIELEKKNIDFFYTEYIQPKYKCWLANDQYIIQKEGYSEIDCRVKWANGFDWSTFSMKVI
jgi:FkbM family methyltransferase